MRAVLEEMIKAVFFDFDGVLTPEHGAMESTVKSILRRFQITREEVIKAYKKADINALHRGNKTVGQYWHDFYGNMKDSLGVPYQKFLAARKEIYEEAELDKEMLELAKKIKNAGYMVGIITDNNKERVELLSDKYGLKKIFDPILVSEEEKITKDDTKIFEKVIAGVGKSVFIDNKQKNCDNAAKAGMVGIYFDDQKRDYKKLVSELNEAGVQV